MSYKPTVKQLLTEKKHKAKPEEEGVFATSPRQSPEFETKADEQRAKSDTAVRKRQQPLVARPEDDRGDSVIRRSVIRRQDEPEKRTKRSAHHHQFIRKIDVGEQTMSNLPSHLLEAVHKSLDATGEGKITQKDVPIRRLQEKGDLDPKEKALLNKLMKESKELEAAISKIKRMPPQEEEEERNKSRAIAKKVGYEARKADTLVVKEQSAPDGVHPKAVDQHNCATHVYHEQYGEGKPLFSQHSEPDRHGNIAWYDVMFEHGIEKRVPITEMQVLQTESHMNHKKKKK